MFNEIPLVNAIYGLVLTVFIFINKNNLGKNKYVRFSLATVVLIYTINCFAEFYISKNENLEYNILIFFAIISFHLIGFFLYLSILGITSKIDKIKPHINILIVLTITRIIFYFLIEDLSAEVMKNGEIIDNNSSSYYTYLVLVTIDELLINILNLIFTIKAYIRVKKTPLIINLNKKNKIYYKWMYIVISINIILFTLMFINSIILIFYKIHIDSIINLEAILYSLFFISLTFSIMYFPVFAISGDYNDLLEKDKIKYKNSNLEDSNKLFKDIDNIVQKDELYLNPELKMNTIAKKLNKSIPYISQAINENTGKSFPDYINTFRIEQAKNKLLTIDTPDTIYAIAIDVGFNNKATFYNAFKKQTNMTPTQYRKKYLKTEKG